MMDSYIVFRQLDGPLGTRRLEVEWQGDPSGEVGFDIRCLKDMDAWTGKFPDVLDVSWLPWRLRKTRDSDFIAGIAYYAREDIGFWISKRAKHLISNLWARFTIRLILTLHIWGLAEYHENMIPSWRDVRCPKRRRGIQNAG